MCSIQWPILLSGRSKLTSFGILKVCQSCYWSIPCVSFLKVESFSSRGAFYIAIFDLGFSLLLQYD